MGPGTRHPIDILVTGDQSHFIDWRFVDLIEHSLAEAVLFMHAHQDVRVLKGRPKDFDPMPWAVVQVVTQVSQLPMRRYDAQFDILYSGRVAKDTDPATEVPY